MPGWLHRPDMLAAALSSPPQVRPAHLRIMLSLALVCAFALGVTALMTPSTPPPLRALVREVTAPVAQKISLTSARGVSIVRKHQALKESNAGTEAVQEANATARGVSQDEILRAVSASRAGGLRDIPSVVRQAVGGGVIESGATAGVAHGAEVEAAAPGAPGQGVFRSLAATSSVAEGVQLGVMAPAGAGQSHDHPPSRLFEHFDADNDGLLSEREVALLLKQLTRKRKDEEAAAAAAAEAKGHNRAAGMHDISIDGETLSVGDGDFDLLFKQLSNLKQTKDPSKDPRMTLQEDIVFVKDLVIVFFAATLGGVLATHFGQPALIGFLLGGMTVGPGGIGAVTELVEVETLASLGIAFLLFCLGIEFSVSELQGVRRVVVLGGLASMVSIVIGTGVMSLFLNLVKTVPEAIALGLAVSLSSTATVLQCLPAEAVASGAQLPEMADVVRSTSWNDGMMSHGSAVRGFTGSHHQRQVSNPAVAAGKTPGSTLLRGPSSSGSVIGDLAAKDGFVGLEGGHGMTMVDLDGDDGRLLNAGNPSTIASVGHAPTFDSPRSRKVMLGLLVFQDVTIGLILALLPTLQGSLGHFVEELLSALLRLGCFTVISLILAEFVLPTLADRVDKAQNQEVFTMGCVVFCLSMAYLSERMGLAIELGAFAAGIMLSESRHKARVEESVEGIRIVFSAVFFISVGMMIHWRYFYQNFLKMLVLLFVILFSKAVVFAVVIFALGGLPIRTAIACGAAIAQAGEFTFVVASKGQALLLFSASEARMINGATALSMLASPYIITFARRWALRGTVRSGS